MHTLAPPQAELETVHAYIRTLGVDYPPPLASQLTADDQAALRSAYDRIRQMTHFGVAECAASTEEQGRVEGDVRRQEFYMTVYPGLRAGSGCCCM